MKLVILESGAKAKTIKKYLGRGWIVEACNGHVQDLPSRGSKDSSKARWASKTGHLPKPPWSWTDKAEQVVSKIVRKAVSSGVDEVFIATDPDREGEFIAWRLSEILSDFKSVNRIAFNEITKEAVLESIANPRGLDMQLVEAAMVRRFMDRLVGFRCSKFSRSWKLKSMGRVQTPTLGFIVDRELEREAHVPIEFHSVVAQSNGVEMKVRFHEPDDNDAWRDDDGKHYPDRTFNSELAKESVNSLNHERKVMLENVKESQVGRSPKPPFTTDSMLQSASSRLGWSISRTSNIASQLYQSGYVTYIRTDSTRTTESSRAAVRKLIEKRFGKEYLGPGMGDSSSKSSNVQDAHEAIRPTDPTVSDISEDKDLNALYRLIWSRFAASQMSKSIRERRSLTFKCPEMDLPIHGTSSWRTHSGWEEVFNWAGGNVTTEPPDIGFDTGKFWKISDDPELISDETKPPRRLTESSIIQKMKKAAIGRPSTYVSTVSKLVDRGYIEKDGSTLIPTDNGRTLWVDVAPFYDNQTDYGDGIFSTEFTAIMEQKLDQIEIGNNDPSEIWEDFVVVFSETHNMALEKRREKPTLRQIDYLKSVTSRMNDEDRMAILGGKEPADMSGEEAKHAIELISNSEGAHMPPSEKQISLIIRLVDKLGIKLNEFLKENDISDVEELTGGRNGSASEIISKLIDLDNSSPATEKQIATIQSMASDVGISVEQSMEIVRAESIENISKSDASELISKIKKRIKSKPRRKN